MRVMNGAIRNDDGEFNDLAVAYRTPAPMPYDSEMLRHEDPASFEFTLGDLASMTAGLIALADQFSDAWEGTGRARALIGMRLGPLTDHDNKLVAETAEHLVLILLSDVVPQVEPPVPPMPRYPRQPMRRHRRRR